MTECLPSLWRTWRTSIVFAGQDRCALYGQFPSGVIQGILECSFGHDKKQASPVSAEIEFPRVDLLLLLQLACAVWPGNHPTIWRDLHIPVWETCSKSWHPKGSKRFFSRFLTSACNRGNPSGTRMPENTSVFKHFGAFWPRGSWPPSENALKSTV